jgi:hypothetical protein
MFDSDDDSDDSNFNDYHSMPVFKKAEEIAGIVRTICQLIEDNDIAEPVKELMLSNAYLIPAKIVGAEAIDMYGLKFDNAMLIKLAARELSTQVTFLKQLEVCNEKYLTMLKEEIEEFRVLFLEWVKGFDKSNDLPDEWDIRNL